MNSIGLTLGFLVVTGVTGGAVNRLLRLKPSIPMAFLTGFVFYLAVFELLALPFMLQKGSFELLYALFMGIVLVTSGVAFVVVVKKRRPLLGAFDGGKGELKVSVVLPWLLLGVLLLVQGGIILFLAHYDSDDSFYIGILNTILTTGKVFPYEPSTGVAAFPYPATYSLVGYEVLAACLSKVSGIAPVVLCHRILPLIYLGLSTLAFYLLGKVLFTPKQLPWFLVLVAVFHLFAEYSHYFSGWFILVRGWQGKGLLVNMLLPMLFFVYNQILTGRGEKGFNGSYILVILILLAGACLSTVGVYLLPVAYFCLVVAAAVYYRDVGLFWRSALAAIPAFLMLCLVLLVMSSRPDGLSMVTGYSYDYSYHKELMKFFGNKWYWFILYLGASVVAWFVGEKAHRLFLCLYPTVLGLTFLNPLFMPFVARYLTGAPVYWRLFWLLSVNVTIIYVLLRVLGGRRSFWQKGLCVMLVIPLVLPGYFIVREANYVPAENAEQLPQALINLCDAALEEEVTPVLLAPEKYQRMVRQYSGEIINLWPKKNYVEESYQRIGETEIFELLDIQYHALYKDGAGEVTTAALEKLGINALIVPDDCAEKVPKEFVPLRREGDCVLYGHFAQ